MRAPGRDPHFWKANPDYPARPEVAARMLAARMLVVADGRHPPDLARRLVLPRLDAVFVEPPSGGLEHSELAATSPGKSLRSLDALAAVLERLLAGE